MKDLSNSIGLDCAALATKIANYLRRHWRWAGSLKLRLTLSDTGNVLAWQWSGGESVAAWKALLTQVAAPGVLVSDGGTGIPTALGTCWPETKHQRCLFHLQMRVSRHLTMNPRTDAGKALRGLVMNLSDVQDEDTAISWQIQLDEWWRTFGHLTKERTLLRNGQFAFTHDRLRKAWHLVRRVVRNNTLFTYVTYGNPRTTSPLEGGINSQIREILRRHRGMSEAHQKRAVEWYLTLHEQSLDEAMQHALPAKLEAPEPAKPADADEPDTPLYDTALSPDEGLWMRSGWAGRG